jgi:hypothetical protein
VDVDEARATGRRVRQIRHVRRKSLAGIERLAGIGEQPPGLIRDIHCAFAGQFRPHRSGGIWLHLLDRKPGGQTSSEQDFPPVFAALEATTGGAKSARTTGAKRFRQRQTSWSPWPSRS